MAKNITTAQQSVASRIREVPMRSPSLPNRGAEISADTPGTAAIIPARKAILLLSGAIDLINSARIGPIEPLQLITGGEEQVDHQPRIGQRGKDLFPGETLAFADLGERPL